MMSQLIWNILTYPILLLHKTDLKHARRLISLAILPHLWSNLHTYQNFRWRNAAVALTMSTHNDVSLDRRDSVDFRCHWSTCSQQCSDAEALFVSLQIIPARCKLILISSLRSTFARPISAERLPTTLTSFVNGRSVRSEPADATTWHRTFVHMSPSDHMHARSVKKHSNA